MNNTSIPHAATLKNSLPVKAWVASAVLILAFGSFAPNSRAEGSRPASFTTVTDENLQKIEALHQEAAGLLAEHQFREAIRIYSEIILAEPDDDAAYTNMGQAYLVLGDLGRAKEAFQNALTINPNNEIAVFGLRKIVDPDFSG